ncbi:Uncharacterised protein [Serratia fonticola]|uniref:Bifunctional ATP-dependent DNA helicase/DNA polymerase III subunit epsilon n=1 Tax=Serratia fonticola TaxID=47917 RepID=A0A4U9TGV4_SERFO|nr:Uncharacterised protein [Serratia fonticola]
MRATFPAFADQPGGARQLARMLRPMIEANQGRCFFLCTSHQMMRELAEEFRAHLDAAGAAARGNQQGSTVAQFVEAGNALLWQPAASGKGLTCAVMRSLA